MKFISFEKAGVAGYGVTDGDQALELRHIADEVLSPVPGANDGHPWLCHGHAPSRGFASDDSTG